MRGARSVPGAQRLGEGRWRVVGLGGVERGVEVGGLEAQLADLLEELALLPDAVGEEAEDHEEEDDDGDVAEPGEEGGALFCEVAEEAAGEDEGFAPDERAEEIPDEEAREIHADLHGDGRGA